MEYSLSNIGSLASIIGLPIAIFSLFGITLKINKIIKKQFTVKLNTSGDVRNIKVVKRIVDLFFSNKISIDQIHIKIAEPEDFSIRVLAAQKECIVSLREKEDKLQNMLLLLLTDDAFRMLYSCKDNITKSDLVNLLCKSFSSFFEKELPNGFLIECFYNNKELHNSPVCEKVEIDKNKFIDLIKNILDLDSIDNLIYPLGITVGDINVKDNNWVWNIVYPKIISKIALVCTKSEIEENISKLLMLYSWQVRIA